ncbi:hypothetical protein FG386_001579 [Cryptosporidium ryanae]|uniref:uncharacterized protein n=1 Tax=Cryptosporidium ryanae TaxID=515981 RepID=UPI00351A1519|nr:hypothetical protein FG386_001579 [Cryptosporidium ryanae]
MLKYSADGRSSDKNAKCEDLTKFELLEADDTLRGLLLRNIYKLELKDEVLKEVMGVDNILLSPGEIIGVFGTTGSGKSMLVQQIMSNVLLPKEIDGEGLRVHYLDTDNGFFVQVFIEKYLIPTIEKRMAELEGASRHEYIHEIVKYNKNKNAYLNSIIKLCLQNLNVIQVPDLLDLLCVIREMTLKSYDMGVFVIDSLNFWNAQLNSLVINNFKDDNTLVRDKQKQETHYYNHIFGYYTNKNTVFNSVCSLVKCVSHFCGYIGVISINEGDSPYSLDFKAKNSSCAYSEELVELSSLYHSKDNQLRVKAKDSDLSEVIVLKFPTVKNHVSIKNNLNKLLLNNGENYFKNIIFISKPSLPVCEEIHNNPNYPVIPSYFVCTNSINNEKTFIALDDCNGLVVL